MFGQSLLSAFGSAACTTDTDQLFTTDVQTTSVATYQLNNATTSIPSNTYPGTPSNITYAAGKFGNAAVFNGSSSYISADNPFAGQSGASQEYSVSIWFKADSFTNTTYPTLFKGFNTSNNGQTPPFVWTNGSIIRFHGYTYADASVSLSTGVWYHLVVIENNSTIQIYLNGVLQSLNASTTWNQVNGNKILFGGDTASMNNTAFDGQIDQVRIFNSVLPQSAVTALYNETTTTATYPYIDYVDANPNSVAYYKMSDATDQLGNYNGTATNVNFNTEGKFGFAGAFNGSSSHMDFPSPIPYTNTDMTFSCWVKLNSAFSSSFRTIIGAGNKSTGEGIIRLLLRYDSANSYKIEPVRAYSGNSYYTASSNYSAQTINAGSWYNIVYTYSASGNTAKIYINGSLVSTTSLTTTSTDPTNSGVLALGQYRDGASSALFWNGSIDQVRIYDSALSAENVTSLYNEIECPAVAVTNAFNTVIYTGTGTSGGDIQNITGVGFSPGLTWVKNRSFALNHYLYDSIRGTGAAKALHSNTTDSEASGSTYSANGGVSSFSSDGFGAYRGSDNTYQGTNMNGQNYVAWNWKAGGTAVSNTDGTITSQVSANTDAGFSITKYTGNGISGATFGHALGKQVEISIVKNVGSSGYWYVYSNLLPTNNNLYLNTSDSKQADGVMLGGNSTTVSISASSAVNTNNGSYIAYNFTSIPGYSKVGSYTGTGASGNSIYTGFQTSYVMTKNIDDGASFDRWYIQDSVRGGGKILYADESLAEGNYTSVQFDSNGFTLNTTDTGINESGKNYIFLAIA